MRTARWLTAVLYSLALVAMAVLIFGLVAAALSPEGASLHVIPIVLESDVPFVQDGRPAPSDPEASSRTLAGVGVTNAVIHIGLAQTGVSPRAEGLVIALLASLALGTILSLARAFDGIAKGGGLTPSVAGATLRAGALMALAAVFVGGIHTWALERVATTLDIEGFSVVAGFQMAWWPLLTGIALVCLGSVLRQGAEIAADHAMTV